MRTKVQERSRAIQLRKQGKSYKEIMTKVPVSKGTLSKWLSRLPLTQKEEKFLTERSAVLQDGGRLKAALKNSEKHEMRRDRTRVKAKIDFEKYKNDPFFVLGLSLYWAEGAQKDNYFSFISADTGMVKIMMQWATTYLKVEPVEYKFRLYIHKTHKKENCERYWSRACAIPKSQFQKTIYTSTQNSQKTNPEYKGSLRMIMSGVEHQITVKAWQKCLSEYYIEAL